MIMHEYKAASCFRSLSDPHIKTGVIKSPIPSSDPDSAGEESAMAICCPHEAWREAGREEKTEMKPTHILDVCCVSLERCNEFFL